MPTDKPRITITIDEETMRSVKDYQFANRHDNQTQAILELIGIGLETSGRAPKRTTPNLSKAAMQLARVYDNDLDDYGRRLMRIVAEHERKRLEDEIVRQAPGDSRTADGDFSDLINTQ